MIRDDHEYQASLDWCAGDPVRHGLVARAADWPFSMATRRLVTRTPTAT
jgi:putative transposase